jgi:hypothetical protein
MAWCGSRAGYKFEHTLILKGYGTGGDCAVAFLETGLGLSWVLQHHRLMANYFS